jgi:hypothetical protein
MKDIGKSHKITDVYHPNYGEDGDYEEFFWVDDVWYMGNFYTMSMSHVLVRCNLGGTVEIPDFVKILSHQDSAGAFEGNLLVQKVIIPNSVTWINWGTFAGCENLEEVVIPNSVTRIAADAFAGCSKLRRIHIQDGVSKIWDKIFCGCVSLEEITIPDSVTEIGDYALSMYSEDGWPQESKLTSIVVPVSVTTIGEGAFSGNLSLKSVVLPKAITEIPDKCFCDCPSVVRIEIPDGVRRIGREAFGPGPDQLWDAENYALKEVQLPSGLEKIESEAFSCCKNLESINIPDSVTEIGDYAFSGCGKLTSIVVPASVTAIGERAFIGNASLQSVVLPTTITEIPDRCFCECPSIVRIEIPDGVRRIGKLAFGPDLWSDTDNFALKEVRLPGGLEKIESRAFWKCENLESINIPDSVTEIGDYAFFCCGKLPVAARERILSINQGAFGYGDGIETANDTEELRFAIAHVTDGGTITLTGDITYTSKISTISTGKSFAIDLNGNTLAITNECRVGGAGMHWAGIRISNDATLTVQGDGTLEVTGTTYGIFAENGGKFAVNGNAIINVAATGERGTGAFADGSGSEVNVTGNVTATGESGTGAKAKSGGTVNVSGDVTVTGKSATGVYAYYGGSEVNVTGNVTATGGRCQCAIAYDGGTVNVSGDAAATDAGGTGAVARKKGSQITIGGSITADRYVYVDSAEKTPGDITTPTTKDGYLTYTEGADTVWVKNYTGAMNGGSSHD